MIEANGKLSLFILFVVGVVIILANYDFSGVSPDHEESATIVIQNYEQNSNREDKPLVNAFVSVSGSTGHLFLGEKIREFEGERFFQSYARDHIGKTQETLDGKHCSHWSVVTTINEPTRAVQKQASIRGWCLVVVGDKKGPKTYDIKSESQFVFLDVDKQEELASKFHIYKHIPWNHFGRKNIGYLYAITHGAKVIYDFDDDNALIGNGHVLSLLSSKIDRSKSLITNTSVETTASYHFHENYTASAFSRGLNLHVLEVESISAGQALNPYPLLGSPSPCWPRGFPLEQIKSHAARGQKLTHATVSVTQIAVVQFLANHDPDLDALYRLTLPLPFDFPQHHQQAVALPLHGDSHGYVFAPYNAQTTLVLRDAFWSLLLPISVHGRVTDIWRAYFSERLFADIGLRVIFHPPAVVHERNEHQYLADLDSELPLYKQSGKLLEQLSAWRPSCKSLPGRFEELWIFLFERGYIEESDVLLMQSWLRDLADAGYEFPQIPEEINSDINNENNNTLVSLRKR